MKKKKSKLKINPIDAVVIAVVVLLTLIFILGTTIKKSETGTPMLLTVEITDQNQISLIQKEAEKSGSVYLNSVNKPVQVVKVEKNGDKLDIQVLGQGEISNGTYIFNGARVLIGQKAEIHSGYFAQGYIKDVKEAK